MIGCGGSQERCFAAPKFEESISIVLTLVVITNTIGLWLVGSRPKSNKLSRSAASGRGGCFCFSAQRVSCNGAAVSCWRHTGFLPRNTMHYGFYAGRKHKDARAARA